MEFTICFALGAIFALLVAILIEFSANKGLEKKCNPKKAVNAITPLSTEGKNMADQFEQYQNLLSYTGKPQKGAKIDEN